MKMKLFGVGSLADTRLYVSIRYEEN